MSPRGSTALRELTIPRGDLVRSRVVADVADALADALDRRLTGYAVVEPGRRFLLGDDARGVLTFADGVPVLSYCEATDRGGTDALADLAPVGPCAVDLFELPESALAHAHDTPSLRVPPGMPAEDLGRDPDLAERTRERAPDARLEREPTAPEAFLADEARIAAIQNEARAEARERAAEWGLADQLVEEGYDEGAGDDVHDEPNPTAGDEPNPTAGDEPNPTAGDEPNPTAGDEPNPTAGDNPPPDAGDDPPPDAG